MNRHAKRLGREPSIGRLSLRSAIQLIIVALLLYALIAGFSGLHSSLTTIQHASGEFVLFAFGLVVLSYVMATVTYILLSLKALRFWPTFLIQITGGLVNRLLPAGLGGLGINGLYLHRRGYSIATSAAIVALNNLIGFVGNVLLIGIISLTYPISLHPISLPRNTSFVILGVALMCIVVAFVVLRRTKTSRNIQHSLKEVLQYMQLLIRRPVRSFGALLSSCLLTCLHATALWLVIHATYASVPWPIALLAISIGSFTGALIPTPGGVGGAEAGIAGILISFGLSPAEGVAAAVVYRGLTYWIPLIPGYIAFRIVEKRYL
jgi:uncharacterized membrane protein YbhN (UPF0104 family)